jgi:hypothetical protein
VPALVLATRKCVHVEDRVDPFGGTGFDDSVDQTETAFFDLEVFGIVHEMTVVDRHADTV